MMIGVAPCLALGAHAAKCATGSGDAALSNGKITILCNDGGARLSPVEDAEVCVCSNGVEVFNDRSFLMTSAAAKRLSGKLFFRRTIEGGFAADVVEGGELFVVTPTARHGRTLSQGQTLARLGFEKVAGEPFQAFGDHSCDIADIWRKDMRKGERLELGKWALVCGFDPKGQPPPDAGLSEKERRLLSYLKGTPSETEAPRDIFVNKPDYVVFVPKQPRDVGKRDRSKPGDTYNDHFQVIGNPSNGLLYAFWTQASKECDCDQHIAFSKSSDKGVTWTPPVAIAGSPNKKTPTLIASWQQPMLAKSGRLYCLWNQQTTSRGPHCGMMFGTFSDDDGETWSAPKLVPFTQRMDADAADDHIPPCWCNWQRPLRLGEGGKFLVGCSRHGKAPYDARGGCKVEFWQFENIDENPPVAEIRLSYFATNREALDAAKIEGNSFVPREGPAVEEAAIVKLPDGRLFALMRSSIGHPVWSQSRDCGRTWSAAKPLLDRDGGTAFLHPRSPCPLYDWKGTEAASGTYFALIHNTFDFKSNTAYQPRGQLFLIAGTFRPDAEQPIWFSRPKLFAPRRNGNSFYTSYGIVDGKGVLWYNDRKFYLCGRIIGPEWFK
jgi:hypothetical protein